MSNFKCEERRVVEIPDCKEVNPDDCHRSFHVFLPSIICGDRGLARRGLVDEDRGNMPSYDDRESSPYVDAVGTLPLVFGIHCYGCNVASISIFVEHANSHNMVLVLPEGLHSSFNARHCCGYALDNDIDDMGFLELIQLMLSDEYSFLQSALTYAVGWSNGGFMVMHAASLFRSISPISGYTNAIDPTLKLGTASEPGKGIFLHHGLDDTLVRPGGCCKDPNMPKCCCDIAADECVSVMEVARNWALEVNGCELADGTPSLSIENGGNQIKCSTTLGSECKSNTTICLHDTSGHFNSPSFNEAFPFAEEVMDFFARDACEIHDGTWNGSVCTCSEYYDGPFCLDGPDASVVDRKSEGFHGVKLVVTVCFLFTLVTFNLVRHRKSLAIKTNGRHSSDESGQGVEEMTELVSSQSCHR